MKHSIGYYIAVVEHKAIRAAARWAAINLDDTKLAGLEALSAWLREEGSALGGLGPNEASDLERRHLADSLTFARGWKDRSSPGAILDLGAGAGLPALPLAIAHPASRVTALDRSGRRCRMIRRAVRVLALENVEVVEADIASFVGTYPAVVSRAALPPDRLHGHLQRLVATEGVAVVGGSHVERPQITGYETVEIPAEILDRSAWLLMMASP